MKTGRIKRWALDVNEIALCLARKWWRPIVCLSIGASIVVNGVILPLITNTFPDLPGLAAMIVAASPFAWFRSNEKINGVAEPAMPAQ